MEAEGASVRSEPYGTSTPPVIHGGTSTRHEYKRDDTQWRTRARDCFETALYSFDLAFGPPPVSSYFPRRYSPDKIGAYRFGIPCSAS